MCLGLTGLRLLAQISITPAVAPVVRQGQTFQFTSSQPVVWSLAPGSPGSIDPDGTYHAPVSVVPHQSLGGCQVFSDNNLFNVPVKPAAPYL